MSKSKRRSAWLLMAFIFGLVVLTFFSRSIYASLLPQVKVMKVTPGSVTLDREVDEYYLISNNEHSIYMSYDIRGDEIGIEDILVSTGDMFTEGEPLVRLSEYQGAILLENAAKDLAKAQRAIDEWQHEFELEIESLLRRQQTLTSDDDYEEKIMIRDTLSFMKKQEVYGSVYLSDLQEEYDACQTRLGYLEQLRNDNWCIVAPEEGILLRENIEMGTKISGGDMIMVYAPRGAQISLLATVDMEWKDKISSVRVQMAFEKGVDNKWMYEGIKKEESGETRLVLVPDNNFERFNELSTLQIVIQSKYFEKIIPMNALDTGSLYVMRLRKGAWNKEEYYVEKVDYRIVADGNSSIAIEGDVNVGDLVVYQSTKDLTDGGVVYYLPE